MLIKEYYDINDFDRLNKDKPYNYNIDGIIFMPTYIYQI